MSAHLHIPFDDNSFISMAIMCCITLVVALFNLTHFVSDLVPWFQLAALSMTVYVGYRTIRKQQNKKP